jgi:hypothetical protein
MSHDRQRGATSSLECYLTPTEKQQLILPIDLLHQLDNIFNENPNLDEIGIMYVDSIEKEKQKKNKTPAWCAEDAFVIPEPKKLGIAAWCLRPLFEAAKNRFERLLTSSSVTIYQQSLLLLQKTERSIGSSASAVYTDLTKWNGSSQARIFVLIYRPRKRKKPLVNFEKKIPNRDFPYYNTVV